MKYSFDKLVKLITLLRSEDGCPWDREQTIESYKAMLQDELDEVVEAIDKKDYENLKEELGDLLYNVVAVMRIAEENGHFTVKEVLEGIHEKLVRRHPHVFGDKKFDSTEEVIEEWNKIKKKEKN